MVDKYVIPSMSGKSMLRYHGTYSKVEFGSLSYNLHLPFVR